jgi:hypothetical protein
MCPHYSHSAMANNHNANRPLPRPRPLSTARSEMTGTIKRMTGQRRTTGGQSLYNPCTRFNFIDRSSVHRTFTFLPPNVLSPIPQALNDLCLIATLLSSSSAARQPHWPHLRPNPLKVTCSHYLCSHPTADAASP